MIILTFKLCAIFLNKNVTINIKNMQILVSTKHIIIDNVLNMHRKSLERMPVFEMTYCRLNTFDTLLLVTVLSSAEKHFPEHHKYLPFMQVFNMMINVCINCPMLHVD